LWWLERKRVSNMVFIICGDHNYFSYFTPFFLGGGGGCGACAVLHSSGFTLQ